MIDFEEGIAVAVKALNTPLGRGSNRVIVLTEDVVRNKFAHLMSSAVRFFSILNNRRRHYLPPRLKTAPPSDDRESFSADSRGQTPASRW